MSKKQKTESKNQEIDNDALVKGGVAGGLYGAFASATSWAVDNALGYPERLKYLEDRIVGSNYALHHSIWDITSPEFQAAIGNSEPEKFRELVEKDLAKNEAAKQFILNCRLISKCVIVAGVIVTGALAYNHFHEQNIKKEEQPSNKLYETDLILHEQMLELNAQKKR
jgi:hypothetical protein